MMLSESTDIIDVNCIESVLFIISRVYKEYIILNTINKENKSYQITIRTTFYPHTILVYPHNCINVDTDDKTTTLLINYHYIHDNNLFYNFVK